MLLRSVLLKFLRGLRETRTASRLMMMIPSSSPHPNLKHGLIIRCYHRSTCETAMHRIIHSLHHQPPHDDFSPVQIPFLLVSLLLLFASSHCSILTLLIFSPILSFDRSSQNVKVSRSEKKVLYSLLFHNSSLSHHRL